MLIDQVNIDQTLTKSSKKVFFMSETQNKLESHFVEVQNRASYLSVLINRVSLFARVFLQQSYPVLLCMETVKIICKIFML